MDGDSWVQQAAADAGPCPRCGAHNVRPIVYGYPLVDDVERLGDAVEFAGCCIPPDPPAYRCAVCGTAWGRAC